MDRLARDVSYALRRLARAPGFTIIAVLTLALGIGANAAIFTVVRALLLEPMPYGDPDRLVMIWRPNTSGQTWLAVPEIASYRQSATSFQQVAAWTTSAADLTDGAEPERPDKRCGLFLLAGAHLTRRGEPRSEQREASCEPRD